MEPTPDSLPRAPIRLRFQLLAFSVARFVINTGHRMVYPFLPRFARGLGVDLETIAQAVTARSALGLLGPAFGMLADARGRKMAMLTALLIFAVGMLLVTAWPTYPALFAALLLASTSKQIFDPAMQAYLGDRVHYRQRGLAIAVTELGWSGAFLLGVPVAGWLIARSGSWRAPFPVLAGCAALAAILLWRLLPADERLPSGVRPSWTGGMPAVIHSAPALAGLSISLLLSAGNEVVNIVFGAWMEDSFHLKIAALGAASAVIGLAELGGEGLVAGLVDRFGKQRSILVGIVLNALACLLLPALGFSVTGALIGLFLLFITFEFALVSAIPLMTELLPEARATMMAGNVAGLSAGRMIGALIGPWLFDLGLVANGITGAFFDALAVALLLIFLRRR